MNIASTQTQAQPTQPYKFDPFSQKLLIVMSVICVIPIILNLLGVDFASVGEKFHLHELASSDVSKAKLVDNMFYALTGGLTHGLLEWSAVMAAILTAVLAFSHYAINKDVTTPIIGVALLCSGAMDSFHTLAAMRLIEAVAPNTNLIPFTWALSRGFNAGIMIFGVLICLRLRVTDSRVGLKWIGVISGLFAAASYFLITYAANSAELPQTQFPDALVTRPYDVLPLFMFVLAIPIFWKLYRSSPNLLTAALLIALIPEIVLEAHMAFGSQALFDNHFNIAHFLKILAYMVPFLGLTGEYVASYQKQVKSTQQLADGAQRIQAVMDTAVDGIITIDAQGIIQDCNPAANKIFGYQVGEIVGNSLQMLMPAYFYTEQDGYLLSQQDENMVLKTGSCEIEGNKKDGSKFAMDLSIGEMILNDQIHYSVLTRDITERKASIEALKATNEELERFAYIASHDLKAPLRVIDNTSKWLEEDLAEHLTGDNRENMDLMRGRVARMEKLLDDLLEYSRVGRNTDDQYQEQVNGVTMIDEIMELLAPPEEFTIEVSQTFASIHVLKMPLQQILLNLINNALKHHDKTHGLIQVGVEDCAGQYRFTVTDDGPGIPQAFQEQVFDMFQTLKPRDQVEGSGMGLAMVKKHVDFAGGTVHVESIEGQGSTFTIHWPKQHIMEGQPA